MITTPPQPKKSLLSTFVSLRRYNFRLFWFGQMISLLGTAMQSIGQAWLVLQLTHSAWQLGVIGAIQALPILLFSLFGGVFADRWPKRLVLLLTQTASMFQALLLWILIISGAIQLWQLYTLAFLLGVSNVLYRPASLSFIPELVGREDLPNASALVSSLSSLARIVGPGLGGIIIAISNVRMLFLINALSFLPVIAALLLLKSHELHIHRQQDTEIVAQKHLWRNLNEGFVYVLRTPAILLPIAITGLVLLFGSNFNVILPLFATTVLNQGSIGFGFLLAATGAGALLAAIWLAWNNQQPTIRYLLILMLIFSALEIAFVFSHLYPLSLLLITCVGFTEEAFAVQAMIALQISAPSHLSGRVMSVQMLSFDGSLPLGYLLMGWLASLFGPASALFIGAILCLLTISLGWLWQKSTR
jgi:MFS family permease